MARLLGALFLLATVSNVWAQTNRERFELFTDCQPLSLYVFVQQSEGDELASLTDAAVRNAIESRLRSARLFTDDQIFPALNVFVQVTGAAFHVTLYVEKSFFDITSGETSYATTWRISSTGTHGSDGSYVLSAVSQHMDGFLVEYLRVNEEACAGQ